jgi:hypothetical protein
MKKVLVVALVVATLGSLAGFAIPVLADGPEGGGTIPADQEAWETMHEACEEGDWEAMAEAAEEVHGEDLGSMPCHGEGYPTPEDEVRVPTSGWGGMGGHMGGGMIGGGWGSMM